jgi:hypothetical protein
MHPPVREFGVSGRLLAISALRRLLRARPKRPRSRAAEQRNEHALSHAKLPIEDKAYQKGGVMRHGKIEPPTSLVGQTRLTDKLPTLAACPLRAESDSRRSKCDPSLRAISGS